MKDSTKKKYRIDFRNVRESDRIIDKRPDSINIHLSTFLYEFNALAIHDYLLPDIIQALQDVDADIDNGSEIIAITIYHKEVHLYPPDEETFIIPTLEFKEIVEAWLDFLLSPPLNGAMLWRPNFLDWRYWNNKFRRLK